MVASKHREDEVYRAVEMGELMIDDDGRIWRVAARRWDRWTAQTRSIACVPRRAEKSAGAYLQVRMMIDGVRSHALAHRLVWRHFHGPIPAGLLINHRDGVKSHNHPSNLELATVSQNALHAIEQLGYRPERNFHG